MILLCEADLCCCECKPRAWPLAKADLGKTAVRMEILSTLANCKSSCCSFLLPCIFQFNQSSFTSSFCSPSHLDVCTHGSRCIPRELSVSKVRFSICCWTPFWQKWPCQNPRRSHKGGQKFYLVWGSILDSLFFLVLIQWRLIGRKKMPASLILIRHKLCSLSWVRL